MELNKIYEGTCLDVIRTFPDKSIDCVITSPPYWQLRDYGWSGQWGMEKTFQEYLEHLWELMDEIHRVLKISGTVWINLGDTYNGNKTGHTDNKTNPAVKLNNIEKKKQEAANKCLLLIPHRFAIGCIDRGWIVRNDIVWAKRNGMPESVTDRFSKKHEYFFFMVKSEKYYFDLDGIRDKIKTASLERYKYDFKGNPEGLDRLQSGRPEIKSINDLSEEQIELFSINSKYGLEEKSNSKSLGEMRQFKRKMGLPEGHINGKNPGTISDFWDITTKGNSEQHYAAYNTELIDKPIVAGCPQYVCNKCGKPREKIFETKETKETKENTYQVDASGKSGGTKKTFNGGSSRDVIGLTDCGCNAGFTGGIILDPFCGTATTGCRAIDLQRKFIGIEGSPEYVKIGNKKLLPFQITQQLF